MGLSRLILQLSREMGIPRSELMQRMNWDELLDHVADMQLIAEERSQES